MSDQAINPASIDIESNSEIKYVVSEVIDQIVSDINVETESPQSPQTENTPVETVAIDIKAEDDNNLDLIGAQVSFDDDDFDREEAEEERRASGIMSDDDGEAGLNNGSTSDTMITDGSGKEALTEPSMDANEQVENEYEGKINDNAAVKEGGDISIEKPDVVSDIVNSAEAQPATNVEVTPSDKGKGESPQSQEIKQEVVAVVEPVIQQPMKKNTLSKLFQSVECTDEDIDFDKDEDSQPGPFLSTILSAENESSFDSSMKESVNMPPPPVPTAQPKTSSPAETSSSHSQRSLLPPPPPDNEYDGDDATELAHMHIERLMSLLLRMYKPRSSSGSSSPPLASSSPHGAYVQQPWFTPATKISSSDRLLLSCYDALGRPRPEVVFDSPNSRDDNSYIPKRNSLMDTFRRFSYRSLKDAILPGLTSFDAMRDATVADAPITDIVIVPGNEVPPDGYYRVSESMNGQRLPEMGGGYLCYKKGGRDVIVALAVVKLDKEFIPAGYHGVVSIKQGVKGKSPVDLSNDNEKICLCYKKSIYDNNMPIITDLGCLFKGMASSNGYQVVWNTPQGSSAEINITSHHHSPPQIQTVITYKHVLTRLSIPSALSMPSNRSIGASGKASTQRSLSSDHEDSSTSNTTERQSDYEQDSMVNAVVSSPAKSNMLESMAVTPISPVSPTTSSTPPHSPTSSHASLTTDDPMNELSEMAANASLSSPSPPPKPSKKKSKRERFRSADTASGEESGEESEDGILDDDDVHAVRRRSSSVLVDIVGTQQKLIYPFLSALYDRRPVVSMKALEGLEALLTKSNFFENSTSLLELAMLTVSDHIINVTNQSHFNLAISFLRSAAAFTESSKIGLVGCRTAMMSFGFTSFFKVRGWSGVAKRYSGGLKSFDDSRVSFNGRSSSMEDPHAMLESLDGYQGISTLIQTLILEVEEECKNYSKLMRKLHDDSSDEEESDSSSPSNTTSSTSQTKASIKPAVVSGGSANSSSMVTSIVTDLVNEIAERCELAHHVDGSLKYMRRCGGTRAFHSDTLWRHLASLSSKIFFEYEEPASLRLFLAFGMLCASGMEPIPKSYWQTNTSTSSNNASLSANSKQVGIQAIVQREALLKREEMLSAKELCLVCVCDFLNKVKDGMKNSLRWGFLVRRHVVSLILTNFSIALEEPRLLQPLMRLLTLCWRHFRKHLKVELSMIIDDLLLRILKAKTDLEISGEVQASVLKEMCGWLLGSEMSEVYLNFDIEKGAMTGKSLYRELCATLCTIGENKQAQENEMSLSALHAIGEVMRSLLDMSGHVQYMASNLRVRAMSMTNNGIGGWETLETTPASDLPPSSLSPKLMASSSSNDSFGDIDAELVSDEVDIDIDDDYGSDGKKETTGSEEDAEPIRLKIKRSSLENTSNLKVDVTATVLEKQTSSSSSSPSSSTPRGSGGRPSSLKKVTSFRARQDEGQRSKGVLAQGLEIYENKNLGKCIAYLIAQNYITDSPREIASFLRMNIQYFSEEELGDYLGGGDTEYHDAIRYNFCSPISFVGLTVEQALRHFLTSAHFRLPGEAQKIDRLINTFANCWWADNISKSSNAKETSLSNRNSNGGMNGVSGGNNDHLLGWQPDNVDSVYLLAFAVIMLNTDLHRASNKKHKKMKKAAFVYNLSRGDDSIPKELLEEIYDSVAAEQIKMPVAGAAPTAAEEKEKLKSSMALFEDKIKFQNSFKQSLLRSEELFQGLSLYHHQYYMLGVDMHVNLEVVLSMFDIVWWMVHAVLTSILENKQMPVENICESLTILQSAIGASIFLGLDKERVAFLSLLAKFKAAYDIPLASPRGHLGIGGGGSSSGGGGGGGGFATHTSRLMMPAQEKWFQYLKNAKPNEGMDMMATHLIPIMMQLRMSVENDHDSSLVANAMKDVVSTLEGGEEFVDGQRRFIKEGDLVKVSRNGGKKTYRFILFSDQLIYAAKTTFGSGNYRIHNRLLLSHIKLDLDIFDERSFHLTHPMKSFMVLAESGEDRADWSRAITDAAATCRPQTELSLREEEAHEESQERTSESK